jgi:hypothetical protein
MPNGMRWVGLDVHASAAAVFDDVTGGSRARTEILWCRAGR